MFNVQSIHDVSIFYDFSVFRVRAKSYFDFTVSFEMEVLSPEGSNYFRINSMGDVFATDRLIHTQDPHQYRYSVTALDRSGLRSTAEVGCLLSNDS